MNQKFNLIILFLSLVFLFSCTIFSYAELVVHEGLPNKEGVKPDPLSPALQDPDLPNRKGYDLWGRAKLHAAFKTEAQFDDNIFLENEGEDCDFLTILTPSVGLDIPFGDNKLSIDSETSVNIFTVHNDQSYVDERLRGVLEINWTDYKLFVTDVYKYFSDRSGSEDVNRIKRQNNFLRTGGAALFDQLRVDAGYTFGVETFMDDSVIYTSPQGEIMTYEDKNRFLHVFDLSASYRFLPKTSILLESFLGLLDYDSSKSSNSWFTETMIGLRGDLRDDFTTSLSAGFRYQHYDDSDLTDSNDFLGFVARGGLAYRPSDDDVISLLIEREVYESTFTNLNYYLINHVGLRYSHFFNDKVSASGFGYFQFNEYPSDATVNGITRRRRDYLYGGGATLRYDVQEWITLEASYERRQRRSSFGTFNYGDNVVTLSATVGF